MGARSIKADEDITQLINDIHGITRKPPLGQARHLVTSKSETGYSAAANSVAKLFVEKSKHGVFADPQYDEETIAKETGLTIDDTKDAIHELSAFF